MDGEFEDIRIVDLDLRRTTWSRVHESMRVVFLRLNRAPPDLDWTRLFHEERASRINARRCGLWIEDDYISFDCLLADVETHHVPDIQRSIDFANRQYRDVLAKRARERDARSAETQAEAAALAALRERVRATFGTDAVAQPPGPDRHGSDALAAPATEPAEAPDPELERRRQALRERYRAALAARPPSGGTS